MTDEVPKRMQIAVSGGSIAGLCAGNALLATGQDVHVFERSATRLTSKGAGIVVQPSLTTLLNSVDAPPLAMTSCSSRRTYSGVGGVFYQHQMPQRFTSWEAIYASLIGAFPSDRYHTNAPLEIENSNPDGVTVNVRGQTLKADLLVAADGLRSKVRSAFAPETESRYAGYIAWRGVVDEYELPESLVNFFDDTFSFCEAECGGHALCYFIPGEGGSVDKGTRRLNWVWYVTIPEGAELDAVMTDLKGERRDAAVAAGQVNEAALNDMAHQTKNLEPHFAQLIKATSQPFIQSIIDVVPPTMVFDRVCLLGDAAFVVRPHTAAATAKAATDARALARTLQEFTPDLDHALKVWNEEQVAAGSRLAGYGVMLGERSAGPNAKREIK